MHASGIFRRGLAGFTALLLVSGAVLSTSAIAQAVVPDAAPQNTVETVEQSPNAEAPVPDELVAEAVLADSETAALDPGDSTDDAAGEGGGSPDAPETGAQQDPAPIQESAALEVAEPVEPAVEPQPELDLTSSSVEISQLLQAQLLDANASETGNVSAATLDWGVKQSFRNYIYTMQPEFFKGRSSLLGNTSQVEPNQGTFQWSSGTGNADPRASTADVSFGVGNGVRFESHPMLNGVGDTEYALDMAFTNPRIIVTSATTGELHMDVVGREFIDLNTLGDPYTLLDVTMANLEMPSPIRDGNSITWNAAPATLTAEGSVAFGGFYKAGAELDPVTFSATIGPTETRLSVTAATPVAPGQPAELTATVTPVSAAGSVQFLSDGNTIGTPISTDGGKSKLSVALDAGAHAITAKFTPTDLEKFVPSETTKPFSVAVQRPASLRWGVKDTFRTYIQNPLLAKGSYAPTGGAVKRQDGLIDWTDPTGKVASESVTKLDARFAVEDGVRFQGHSMPLNGGANTPVLDLTFSHPRVVATGAGTGELYLDVAGREYIDSSTHGDFFELPQVLFATLELPTPTVADGMVTWTSASATLTTDGSKAFGGFYKEGVALDPLTISTPLSEGAVIPDPKPSATSLTIKASASRVVAGSSVELTASVAPKSAAGSVQFSQTGKKIGKPVAVKNGTASVQVKNLAAGKARFTAKFTPANPKAFTASVAKTLTITVTKKPTQVKLATVKNASLHWGVRESFRNYVSGPIAHGSIETLGTTKGAFDWRAGTGTAMTDGRSASVSFGKGNGMRFTGHAMAGGNALDITFTNPRVQLTSPTAGVLYLDVTSRKFEGMQSISDTYFTKNNVAVANLVVPAPKASGKTLSWAGVKASLSTSGAEAFGGFYNPGEALDDLSFTFDLDSAAVSAKKTSVSLAASATTVTPDASVTLTASVAPKNVAGKVAFAAGNTKLGAPVAAKNGVASTRTKLPVGIHSVVATFTPNSAAYGHSVSQAVKVTVAQERSGGGAGPGTGGTDGQAAGALSWGVSSAFVAYTTCVNKEAFGYSHCAKDGTISTSGVGAGYVFPQAASSNWDRASQTGTVAYSGSVNFSGYGMAMFNVTNPSITVTSSTSATLQTGNSATYGSAAYELDLAGARKAVGPSGEVTWSGVSVLGSLSSGGAGGSGDQSIGLDNLSFTVGAESSVSYGSTASSDDKKKRTPAATAPATTGVRVLTPATKLKAGGRIEIQADGFDANDEGVLVVLYSDPVVLDEEATADANGRVTWSGTLPKDLTGEHVITLQGSTDAGAVIEILDPNKERRSAESQTGVPEAVAAEAATAGVAVPGIAQGEGMALWEWWASAAGLVAIAGCMTALAVRQRRMVG